MYKTQTKDFVVLSDGKLANYPGIIRDEWYKNLKGGEDKGVAGYFDTVFGTFIDHLEKLRELKRKVNPTEERELKLLLQALITAKNILEDKQ